MSAYPIDWYWQIGSDTSRYWSSKLAAYVAALPVGAGLTVINSEQSLADVLAVYGYLGPVPHIPDTIDLWILRTVLANKGYLTQVQTAIDNSTDLAIKNLWAYGYVTHRNSRFITALTNALGLTSAQVDQVFIAASNVIG